MGRLQKLLSLSWIKFIYYNFLCRRVKRDKGKYLLPNRRARIELGKNAQIIRGIISLCESYMTSMVI